MLPSSVKFSSRQGSILPQQHMEDTMAKLRRWIALTGNAVNIIPKWMTGSLTGCLSREDITWNDY